MDDHKLQVPKPPPETKGNIGAREESPLVKFSEKIGSKTIIEKDVSAKKTASSSTSEAGFRCDTCNASFTSSDAYLDHCNGRVHQKNLGLSYRVERVDDVDRVKARLQTLTKKRIQTEQVIASKSLDYFEKQLDDTVKEDEKLKEERKARKKQKKQEIQLDSSEEAVEENDSELMAALGFKSFK